MLSMEIESNQVKSSNHGDNEVEPFLSPNSNLLVSSSSSSNLTNANDISFPFRKWPQRNIGCLSVMLLLLLPILIFYREGLEERAKAVPIPTVPILNLTTVHPEYLNWLPNDISSIKIRQIQSYRNGSGLMLDFHITHHAGTTLCFWAKSNGPCPEFACMVGENVPEELHSGLGPRNTPWRYQQTDHWVRTIRPVFHYISWEYGLTKLIRSLNDTNWEHPELVSIIVMRHPMERLLSDIGHGHQVIHDTEEEWWEYANNRLTNNFALRTIMSWEGCCQGEWTSDSYLNAAKTYLLRFTFILDMACFDESLTRLSKILGLNYTKKAVNQAKKHASFRNQTLYRYLYHRNVKDIALYEWSKAHSLVKCDDIHHD